MKGRLACRSGPFAQHSALAVVLLIGTAETVSAAGGAVWSRPTVWQRAASPGIRDEQRVYDAATSILAGTGDELDLGVVQVALVDAARGRDFQDVAVKVLLVRLRVELGLDVGKKDVSWLECALLDLPDGPLRNIAAVELGRHHQREGHLRASREALSLAAISPWGGDVVAEARFLRGWQSARADDLTRGHTDLEEALRQARSKRLQIAALLSLSWVVGRQGDAERSSSLFQRATAIEASRANASGRDALTGLELSSQEREMLRRAPATSP